MEKLGELKIGKMEIKLTNNQPVMHQPYHLSHTEYESIFIAELENHRTPIHHYVSLIWVVKKKFE